MLRPLTIPPRYEVEVKSFSQVGNVETSFILRGDTAIELIVQFRSLELAEKDRGYDACLPRSVFELAEYEHLTGSGATLDATITPTASAPSDPPPPKPTR